MDLHGKKRMDRDKKKKTSLPSVLIRVASLHLWVFALINRLLSFKSLHCISFFNFFNENKKKFEFSLNIF